MMAKNLIQSFESGRVLNKQQKNVLIVYAHQEPKSFNGALLRKAVKTLEADGHSVEVSDLYSMHFEPRCQRTDVVGEYRVVMCFKPVGISDKNMVPSKRIFIYVDSYT